MYRVKKADGWNKYKIQERFLWIFWHDISGIIYNSKGRATLALLFIMDNEG